MNIPFLHTLKYLPISFAFIFLFNTSYAQDKEILNRYNYLDSMHYEYDGGHTEEAYSIHHKLLKESSKLAYDKGILCALKSLMWYHGVNKTPNLDSVLHYADLFETKIAIEDIQQDTELIESLWLPQYYLNKGQLLATRLGLPEQGLENYFKAHKLITKMPSDLLGI